MRAGFSRALYGASAVLLVALGLEWMPGGGEPPVPSSAGRPHRAAPAPDAPRETADWAATVLARPLFSTSRRPAKVAANGQPAASSHMPRLAGIMITPQGRKAIFAGEGTAKPLVLGEGGLVNDIAISAIQPNQVLLASGIVLKPAYDKQRVPGANMTQPFVPPGQNFAPGNFPNPGFPNPAVPGAYPAPGLPNNGFTPPGFQPPGFQQPGGFVPPGQAPQPQISQGDSGDQDAVPPPANFPQPFRPNLPLPRRQ